MNVISQVFNDPAAPIDQKAVDMLETLISARLVDAVRMAANRMEACRALLALSEKVEDSELGDGEQRWLLDWIAAASTMLDPEERTGFSHRCGR